MNNLYITDDICELYNTLRHKTNDRRELHYLILYYKYANKEISHNNFNKIFKPYFTLNNIKTVAMKKTIRSSRNIDDSIIVNFMKSYIIKYSQSMELLKLRAPKKVVLYDTIDVWDETETMFDDSGVFYHVFMNHYMEKHPNINWYRNISNMILCTNNKFIYEITKIKYLVETHYINPYIKYIDNKLELYIINELESEKKYNIKNNNVIITA